MKLACRLIPKKQNISKFIPHFLSGLLSHIGLKEAEKQQYLGARNAHFAIFPNSVLFKKQPKWVMAAELVETSKLWGRMVAEIEPEWIEPLAEHLIKKILF